MTNSPKLPPAFTFKLTPQPEKPAAKSFLDLLNAKPAAKQAETKPATPPTRSILFGSGLTARDAERAANQFEKQQERSTSLDIVATGAELDALGDYRLPTTLVPDDLILDPSQEAAATGLLGQQFGVLIGKAGTGKTTTIKFILARIIEQFDTRYGRKPTIAFCAYTGRAVQQIKRALPATYHACCDTIHGLLEYAPEDIEAIDKKTGQPYISRRFVPHRTSRMPLDVDIIFIDEGGMCPIDLWNNLMDATPANARVYLIGDIYQLPPVHGRSVLGFAMLKWPTYELDRIHRTENNAIIDGAWDIMNGRMPQPRDGSIIIKRISDASLEAYQQTLAGVRQLYETNRFNPLRDAIIVPQNDDSLGQNTFNEYFCAYFNPTRMAENLPINPRIFITAGYEHKSLAVGDKVMVTKNDRQQGLTNGMIGIIEAITRNDKFRGETIGDMASAHLDDNADLDLHALGDLLDDSAPESADDDDDSRELQASHIVTVRFQNVQEPISFSTAAGIKTIKHAYAFTCHKSQGGEYEVVVIIVHSTNLNMLSREWLYTAWTRAKSKIILLHNSRGIQHALKRQVIRGQTLADKAREFIKVQEREMRGEKVETPRLPAPVEV